METYFDSRLDLLQRNLAKHSDRLKIKADKAFQEMFKKDFVNKLKSPSGEILADNLEREMQKFKLKVRVLDAFIPVAFTDLVISQVSQRMTSLSASWQTAKIIRTREKITFTFGVMSLLFTALIFGMYPQ